MVIQNGMRLQCNCINSFKLVIVFLNSLCLENNVKIMAKIRSLRLKISEIHQKSKSIASIILNNLSKFKIQMSIKNCT